MRKWGNSTKKSLSPHLLFPQQFFFIFFEIWDHRNATQHTWIWETKGGFPRGKKREAEVRVAKRGVEKSPGLGRRRRSGDGINSFSCAPSSSCMHGATVLFHGDLAVCMQQRGKRECVREVISKRLKTLPFLCSKQSEFAIPHVAVARNCLWKKKELGLELHINTRDFPRLFEHFSVSLYRVL